MTEKVACEASRTAIVGVILTLVAMLAGTMASTAYGSEEDEIFYRTDVGRFAKRAQDFDVGDYVRTGLVAHFDAIRNAGEDEPHSFTTNIWTNLVSGKPDAEFINFTDNNGYWTDDGRGFYFGGVGKNCYAQLKEGLTLASSLTVQLAVNVKTSEQSGGSAGTDKYPGYFHGGKNFDFGVYSNNRSSIQDAIIFKGGSETARPSVSAWGGRYATAMIAMNDDGETYSSYLFEGTSLGTASTTKHDIVNGKEVRFSWGGSPANSKRAVQGTYYNVRIYDCALTEDQLRWNRVVDDARYFGGIAETNLVVASNARGLEGVEPSGEYMVNGSWTFTATNITDGVFVWSPVGYSLEKWDGSDWVFVRNEEGLSFTYKNCTANGRMRLTWLWRQTGNVKGGYDVGDYIPGNLILHFDGIRNAGATADHDSSVTTWANLGTLGSTYDAYKTEFISSKGSVGEWNDSGYYFKGKELFKIGNTTANGTKLDLGEKITVQVYSGFNASDQVATYPCFFGTIHGSEDRMQLYYHSAKLNFKANDDGISTAIGAAWESPFINLVFDAENDVVRLGGETPQSITSDDDDLTSIDGYYYGIGAGQNNDFRRAARALCGNVHSVRVYKEALDDWMLAYNNQIDNVRFNGNVTVVNGAIGESDAVGKSSVEDGVYDIASGTWTITASEQVLDDRRYKPRLTVETLTDGEWVRTKRVWTDSYTIDKSLLGSERIRLTWTWEICHGLIISFH